MSFYSICGRKLTLAMLCLVANLLSAQLRNPFSNLNVPVSPGSFFFPQSFNTIKIPNPYSEMDVLTASQCATLFMSMSRASMDSTHALTDFSGFREHKDSVAHGMGCISLALMDVMYYDFRSDALSSGMIYRDNGQFYHAQGCDESPCLEKESYVLWVDAPHIDARMYRFNLGEGSWISNYADPVDSIFIDFDDGIGWRPLVEGAIYEVDYSWEQRDRIVRSRVYRHGSSVKHAACLLKFSPEYEVCENVWEQLPNYPPWDSDTNNPWDVQIYYDGQEVSGRAYTLTSADEEFDKPFLFVEGIDFGLDRDGHPIHDWIRHGTFGWCEFMSGFQDPDATDDIIYGYDDLHRMPELIQAIREEGYDIVLVDFYDGAGRLEQNSYLVQHVINLCNEFKSGTEPLVVAGASMGGVITRHALRSMELRGEDHCTRLWISMDAPHEGAHIPLSLQHAMRFSADHGQEQAQLFRDRYLLRPAARQMLDAQVFGDLNDYTDWYSQLRELGYPEKCRSVALSNGLSSGEGLSYTDDELMDWECDFSGVVHSKMLLLPESGDVYHESSTPGNPVMAHFRLPIVGSESAGDEWYYWFGGLTFGLIDLVDIEEEIVYAQGEAVNRDYAPGGKRSTIQTFALAINEGLAQTEEDLFGANLCADLTPTHFNPDHCFVSSASSVGILNPNPYIDVAEYAWQHPDENHFDDTWFALGHNENHTEITQHKLNVVLNEVLAIDASDLDTAITGASLNAGVFNFGRPEYSYIRSVHIHQDGQVHVNAMMNTHFNQPQDYLSTDFHFELKTLPCSPEIILIDHGGLMVIGDEYEEYRTGKLIIGRDSRLIIGAGGLLVVHEGSSLVVEEGGLLEVLPGGELIVSSGTLELKAGAICRFQGVEGESVYHELALQGNDARFILSGGDVEIDDLTQVQLHNEEQPGGYIEVTSGMQGTISLGNTSSLTIAGSSTDEVVLRISHGAQLSVYGGVNSGLVLADGMVDLTHNGKLQWYAPGMARSIHFYANDQWEAEGSEVWKWGDTPVFESCRFEHVDLHTVNSKLSLFDCQFIGPNAGVEMLEGAYAIASTSFRNANCTSYDLQAMSVVTDCSFRHNSSLKDWSNQELVVQRSSFLETEISSIEKTTGVLALRCCDFDACGPVVVNYASLDMSTLSNGGTNTFRAVYDCVILNEALSLQLEEGLNDFDGCDHRIFEGSMDTTCTMSDCQFEVIATHNHWGYDYDGLSTNEGLIFPNPQSVRVTASGTVVCSGYESGNACSMKLNDQEPIHPVTCLTQVKRSSSNGQAHTEKWSEVLSGLSSSEETLSIEIYDCEGRVVGSEVLTAGAFFQWDKYSLSVGLYLISAQSLKGAYTLRRIVE